MYPAPKIRLANRAPKALKPLQQQRSEAVGLQRPRRAQHLRASPTRSPRTTALTAAPPEPKGHPREGYPSRR